MASGESPPVLETLPSEIRLDILCILPYDSSQALIMASPVYFKTALEYRDLIRRQNGAASVEAFTLEAEAVYCARRMRLSEAYTQDGPDSDPGYYTESYPPMHASSHYTMETISRFAVSYMRDRKSNRKVLSFASHTGEQRRQMVDFHMSTIMPIARRFTQSALKNFAGQPEAQSSFVHEPITTTEEYRIVRAVYRFELCCQLFDDRAPDLEVVARNKHGIDLATMLQLLHTMFHPWEVEEILCINGFLEIKYNDIFDVATWDFDRNKPKFGYAPNMSCTDPLSRLSRHSYHRDYYLCGTLTRGLGLLQRALSAMEQNHDQQLVEIIKNEMRIEPIGFLGTYSGAVTEICKNALRARRGLSEQDLKRERRDPFPFRGDIIPDPNAEFPPLAWTIIWKDTYSNVVGDAIPYRMRYWGYVMWDAERITKAGGKEILQRQSRGIRG
ncbi:uncharacterized protein BO97DRAFT_428543 [Aspergillus homomorphus CBS 101889]|uniref:F-box domain-containing protein n=1 Tax=Aspergillus homomorphus (strain CBS 101889) TaxID=1450537 RepID=A0A395HL86_ASPHC|nr:hypothetical protein BO97DRAFT_428543 [Aspergillus homomorphus CBS 101889]RAL08239.1 hypothetical protein BO97DRAFT_428543 [Aspergillus homomorphus CBS 101889]